MSTDIGEDRLNARGDEFYSALMQAHAGKSFEESAAINARLVLILANLVGDTDAVLAALDRAKTRRAGQA